MCVPCFPRNDRQDEKIDQKTRSSIKFKTRIVVCFGRTLDAMHAMTKEKMRWEIAMEAEDYDAMLRKLRCEVHASCRLGEGARCRMKLKGAFTA